jgi:hypothetical protein
MIRRQGRRGHKERRKQTSSQQVAVKDKEDSPRKKIYAERATAILYGMTSTAAFSFITRWVAFNTLYNPYYRNDEREALKECIQFCIDEKAAADLLVKLSENVEFLSRLPPGDMRLDPADFRFRRRATIDMERVVNLLIPASVRLSHLVSAVYQIRCNLVHGRKYLAGERDRNLVAVGDSIIGEVLQVLLSSQLGS